MMKFSRLALGLVLALAALQFCTKPDPFGSELFDDQQTGLFFSDTLELRATILHEDSVNTALSERYLLGSLVDPVFGKTEAIINTLFRFSRLSQAFGASPVIDSVVMYVGWYPAGFYGDTAAWQTLEIWRLKDTIAVDADIFSNKTAETTVKIGEATFLPKPNVKKTLLDKTGISTQTDTVGAFIRIALDPAFGQEILALDSADKAASVNLFRKMKGLQLRVTTQNSPCMMSTDLDETDFSKITLFYHNATDTASFNLFFTANKWVNIKHDYSPLVADAIGKPADSLLFLQAGAGLKVKFELPTIRSLSNVIINKAELELTVLDPAIAGDNALLYPASNQFIITEFVEKDTNFVVIPDVLYPQGFFQAGNFSLFGGTKKEETGGVFKYRLNLSDHIQDMISGKKSNTIYLNIYPQDLSVSRAVLVGPGANSPFRAKLNLKYTPL